MIHNNKVLRQIEAIIGAFDDYHLTRGYANYWSTYNVNLVTNERLILQPIDISYNPHYSALTRGQERLGYLTSRSASVMPKDGRITIDGYDYQAEGERSLDRGMVFYALRRTQSAK